MTSELTYVPTHWPLHPKKRARSVLHKQRASAYQYDLARMLHNEGKHEAAIAAQLHAAKLSRYVRWLRDLEW